MGWWVEKPSSAYRAAVQAELRALPLRQRIGLRWWAHRHSLTPWWVWIPLPVSLIAFFGCVALLMLLQPLSALGSILIIGGTWGSCATLTVIAGILGKRLRWWAFADIFPWLCRGCGYDLRGSAGRCPECGRSR